MLVHTRLFIRAAALLAAAFTVAGAAAAEPAAASANGCFQIKDFADKKCFAYANAKAGFGADGDQPVCRVAFGAGEGIFGGFWFPTKKLPAGTTGCRGLGLTVRGNGDSAGSAYVFLRAASGVSYRSKNIGSWFENKEWRDVVLTAGDFEIDPEYAQKNAEAAKALPKEPDWASFDRVYFAAVNFAGEPAMEFKSLYFALGAAAPAAAATAAAPVAASQPAAVPTGDRFQIKDFADKKCFAYANAKAGFGADGDQPVCKVAFGAGEGIFGGFWFPTKKLPAGTTGCRGLGLTVRGNGDSAGSAYVFLRDASGVSYRSKNIGSWFENKEWRDVVLTAGDFEIDPEYAQKNAEAAKALPKEPNWASFDRVYFAAVNFAGEPAIEFKSLYFALGAAAPAAAATAAAPAASKPADPAAKYPGLVLQTNAGDDALVPRAKAAKFPEGTWMERHEKFVAVAAQGDVDVLWLGDSITDNLGRAKGTYNKLFPDLKTANFGIGGDGTQNLLWRLENGELDGIRPKAAVVLIGTNNVQWHPSAQIAAAIKKIIATIRAKCPGTKILLMAIFPRGDLPAGSVGPQRIKEVNALIARLDDGKNVRYLDIGDKLTTSDGTILAEAFADKVHPSTKGYAIWADAIRPMLAEMMK